MSKNPRDGADPPNRGGPRKPAPGSFRARYAVPAALVREALGHGARSFRANLGAYLLGGAIWLIPFFYVSSAVLIYLVGGGASGTGGLDLLSLGLLLLAMAVYLTFIQTGFLNAALRVETGEKLRVGDFFVVPNRGRALATSLLSTILIVVGLLVFVLPGLLAGVWTLFAVVIAVDRGLGPMQAIGASVRLVGKSPVTAMVLGLAVNVVIALGIALLYLPALGLLLIYTPVVLAAPVVVQALVRLYRTFEAMPEPAGPRRP